MAKNGIGLVALMTLRALNLTGVRYMVAVRILLVILGSFGNRFQGLVTGQAGSGRRSRFRLFLFVTGHTSQPAALMAIRSKAFLLLLGHADA